MTTDLAKLKDGANQAAESYSKLVGLRATLAALGGVGAALDAILGGHGQNIAQARIERIITELSRQIETLDESKLDGEFLRSEAFYDLAWRVFEHGQRTASAEKVTYYVRTLTQAATNAPYRENAEEYQDLIASLSENEWAVARAIYQRFPDVRRDFNPSCLDLAVFANPSKLMDLLPGFTEPLTRVYLNQLAGRGLICALEGMIIDYAGDSYYVTDYFGRMMEFYGAGTSPADALANPAG